MPNINDPITAHAKYAYLKFYSHAYPEEKPSQESQSRKIARPLYGMQHACRTAIFWVATVNYLRHKQYPKALAISAEDLKLGQIAGLLNGSGCDDETKKLDQQSARNCYIYLTQGLQVPEPKAAQIAEALYNKYNHDGKHYVLQKSPSGELSWLGTSPYKPAKDKDIFALGLQIADCLDKHRQHEVFGGTHLDLYQLHQQDAKTIPLEDIAQFIIETRSLVERQGDGCLHRVLNIKRDYEKPDCYEHTLRDLASKGEIEYPLLKTLYNEGELFTLSQHIELTALNFPARLLPRNSAIAPLFETKPRDQLREFLMQKMYAGELYARGIFLASELKEDRGISYSKPGQKKPPEIVIATELYKLWRSTTTPARSGAPEKHGNRSRSFCRVLPGSQLFASCGLFLLPSIYAIRIVGGMNFNSGTGNKSNLFYQIQSISTITQQLEQLKVIQMLGGNRVPATGPFQSAHTEIIGDIDIRDVFGIYFCNDYAVTNRNLTQTGRPFHKNSGPLEALFLLYAYQQKFKEYGGIFDDTELKNTLPIVEYSAAHAYLQPRTYEPTQIIELWKEIVTDYLKGLSVVALKLLGENTLDTLKVCAIYGKLPHTSKKKFKPADYYYPPELQAKINLCLEEAIRDKFTRVIDDAFTGKKLPQRKFYLYQPDIHELLSKVNQKYIKDSKAIQATIGELFDQEAKEESPFRLFFKNEPTQELFAQYPLLELAETYDPQGTYPKLKAQAIAFFKNFTEQALIALAPPFAITERATPLNYQWLFSYLIKSSKKLATNLFEGFVDSFRYTWEKLTFELLHQEDPTKKVAVFADIQQLFNLQFENHDDLKNTPGYLLLLKSTLLPYLEQVIKHLSEVITKLPLAADLLWSFLQQYVTISQQIDPSKNFSEITPAILTLLSKFNWSPDPTNLTIMKKVFEVLVSTKTQFAKELIPSLAQPLVVVLERVGYFPPSPDQNPQLTNPDYVLRVLRESQELSSSFPDRDTQQNFLLLIAEQAYKKASPPLPRIRQFMPSFTDMIQVAKLLIAANNFESIKPLLQDALRDCANYFARTIHYHKCNGVGNLDRAMRVAAALPLSNTQRKSIGLPPIPVSDSKLAADVPPSEEERHVKKFKPEVQPAPSSDPFALPAQASLQAPYQNRPAAAAAAAVAAQPQMFATALTRREDAHLDRLPPPPPQMMWPVPSTTFSSSASQSTARFFGPMRPPAPTADKNNLPRPPGPSSGSPKP